MKNNLVKKHTIKETTLYELYDMMLFPILAMYQLPEKLLERVLGDTANFSADQDAIVVFTMFTIISMLETFYFSKNKISVDIG